MGLHMVLQFTDAWGLDGSKGEWRAEGEQRAETRAGYSAVEGVQPGSARPGEEAADVERRCSGAGSFDDRTEVEKL